MGQRLLVVDSDRGFLKEHQVNLEAAFDLEVVTAPDGVLSRLEGGAYAAVLICVEVADNKGYALCSTIRKKAELDGLKIVLISAKATEEEYRRHQGLKGRADLYLHKPVSPSALVAALSPLVPTKALDPDNPFGELVDTELGDDWLDSLKSSLDDPASRGSGEPVFGVRSPSPAKPVNRDARSEVASEVSLDSQQEKLLVKQLAELQEEVRVRDQRLAAAALRILEAEAEAQQIQRQMNSVTLNLDELERSNREAEILRTRLAETESAVRGLEETRGREGETIETLKAQLKEALVERTDLIQQVETLNHQVGDKTQRVIELLKERDRLLGETLDLEPFRARAYELEAALKAKEDAAAAKQAEFESALKAQEGASAAKQAELESTLAGEAEALAARQQELEASLLAQAQLNATLEALVEQHTSLEELHGALLLEVADHKEKVQACQLEAAGLEATLRGQGRDLAELGEQLRQREAELGASQTRVLERDQQLLAQEETLQRQQEEKLHLEAQLAGIRQELNEARILHEGQQLELMNGLDQKEAVITRLNQALMDQQEAHATLDREKQALHGQLSEHRDRLQNLDGLLQEIQDKLRRGSDLARG
jgi:DNA-binding response OmpR family regulator